MALHQNNRLSTGIEGLDIILHGGLIPRRTYLVRGSAGSGKTTLGLHFLSHSDNGLFITFGEKPSQIIDNAENLSIDTSHITFLDLSPGMDIFTDMTQYTVFSPSEIERGPLAEKITEMLDKVRPERIFIDAITQLYYVTNNPIEFRRFVMSMMEYVVKRGVTLLITSEENDSESDGELTFAADGIIHLTSGRNKRELVIPKFRGSGFRYGPHTVRLTDTGMKVYPRLVEPEQSHRVFETEVISSGIPQIDKMLHGGLERGTVTLFTGPTGVGKSTLGMQFMSAAATRGERSVVFTFEEDERTLIERSVALNIPVRDMIDEGRLQIVQIEPLRFTQDEFAAMVTHEVEDLNARIVMIDSVSGYEMSLQGDQLIRHLHTQSKYLRHMGVTTILVNEVHRIIDAFQATEINISYLMDSIVFLRYFESKSELRRAIGVLKKRVSDFEKSMREIEFTEDGIKVGEPLKGLRGILGGLSSQGYDITNPEID
ncbi:ATPase domain-containing protein [Phototrophicus methaneseepsis]|uniref:ATPase domain-containing protein n=1 Tax=Phototrophicus methaneseepsis TaxID=2710758 RepID=UPI0032E49E36